MAQVDPNKEADYGIPVVIPYDDGTSVVYAEARVTDKHIVLTPKSDFRVSNLKDMVDRGLILGMTVSLPEYQHVTHPFLDGNGLDNDPAEHVCQDSECHKDLRYGQYDKMVFNALYRASQGEPLVDVASIHSMVYEDAVNVEESPVNGMAEESPEGKLHRLEGQHAKVKVIEMILRNPGTFEEKLRQIDVVIH